MANLFSTGKWNLFATYTLKFGQWNIRQIVFMDICRYNRKKQQEIWYVVNWI